MNKNKQNKLLNYIKKESGTPKQKPGGTTSSAEKATVPPSLTKKTSSTLNRGSGRAALSTAVGSPAPSGSKPTTQHTIAGGAAASGSRESLMVSARAKEFTRPPPSEASKYDRRTASRILLRQATNPIKEDQVSKEDFVKIQEDIAWAKQVFPDFSLERYGKTQSTKRQRSVEGPSLAPKRVRTHTKTNVVGIKSFAEVAKETRILGVLDEGNEDGKIPKHQWRWVQAALAKVAMEVLRDNPGPPPSCTDAGWFQGSIKLTACANARSAELYKAAVSRVGEAYPGARLKAVEARDIPSRPRARAWFPITPSEPEEILAMLKEFNPSIPTQNWKVVKTEQLDNKPTMQVVLLLNNECLEVLKKTNFAVDYGFEKITLRVYRTDTEALVKIAACTERAAEPSSDVEMECDAVDECQIEEELSDNALGTSLNELFTEDQLLSEGEADTLTSDEDMNVTVVEVKETQDGEGPSNKPPS